MPKCPKCKAEIVKRIMEYCTNLQEWLKSEAADIGFTCPECGERVSLDQVIPDQAEAMNPSNFVV